VYASILNNRSRVLLFFFLLTCVVRFLFIAVTGMHGYDYVPVDAKEYIDLANRALHGNFNFDLVRFVRSPLYPLYVTAHMALFGNFWEQAVTATQILLSGFTCVYVVLIADKMFVNGRVSFVTGMLYLVYVPVFYFTGSFTSECLYQFLYVAGTYHFLRFIDRKRLPEALKFSVLFTLCYLTRSDIGLFFPFIFAVIFYEFRNNLRPAFASLLIFAAVLFLATLPWGLYNKKVHDVYITSSNGGKYVFYLSNSNIGYTDLVATPPYGSPAFKAYIASFAIMDNPAFDSIMALPQAVKQDAFFHRSLNWIKNNPAKFVQVKLMSVARLLLPGESWKHHPFSRWLISFAIGLPVYLLFYAGAFLAIRRDPRRHLWFIGKYLSTVGYVVIFLFTERFRAYSIEPFFLMYVAFALCLILQRFAWLNDSFIGRWIPADNKTVNAV